MAYKSFRDLPVWQAARQYKLAIYELCKSGALAGHQEPREQLCRSVAKPPALIAEAFGRFSPLDAARLLVQAKAELLESQNHLVDAVDRQFIDETLRMKHHRMAQDTIDQIEGWRDYLQSDEAQRNVKDIRERRRRERRRKKEESESESESE